MWMCYKMYTRGRSITELCSQIKKISWGGGKKQRVIHLWVKKKKTLLKVYFWSQIVLFIEQPHGCSWIINGLMMSRNAAMTEDVRVWQGKGDGELMSHLISCAVGWVDNDKQRFPGEGEKISWVETEKHTFVHTCVLKQHLSVSNM